MLEKGDNADLPSISEDDGVSGLAKITRLQFVKGLF